MATTASMLNDVHHVLSSLTTTAEEGTQSSINADTKAALAALNLESIVLMSHSLGSLTAINMLTG